MKKNYTSNSRWGSKALSAAVLALAFTATASAQDEYRKSWDFTKWSAATVANLQTANSVGGNAETREWSDVEKSGASSPTDVSKNNVFWNWKYDVSGGSTSADNFITANGETIAELEGLYYTNTTNGSLAIAVNYQDTGSEYFGPYQGASYLWFGGSKKNYFVIPHVEPGTEIKMGVESHKLNDARGVELYVGRGSSGTKLKDPDGNAVPTPTTYQDLVWLVPEDVEPTNEDGTVDVQIYNTNGCHLYYITVGDGDGGGTEEDKKVAVISPLGEDDDLYFAVQEGFEPTFLTEATAEELQEYEAVLISNKVTADSPMKDVLRGIVAYQPVVNLSAALVEAWGLGTVTDSESNIITVSEANLSNSLFADLTYDEGFELVADGVLPVVTPGEYLANDDVLATVGETPYILVHNASRNAHILIPFAEEATTDSETMTGLVANALKVAAKSKKAVTKTAVPTFSAEQGHLETTVTISGAGVVRYALGADAEVNDESAIYTEPILFKEETMIKAFALQDGYLPSDVVTYEVAIAAKAERPVISVAPGEGKSVVITIEAEEGTDIHYSFAGQLESTRTDASKTAIYSEPITISEPTVVYAFAVGSGLLASDLEEMSVSIPGLDASNIRLDVVSQFTGGSAWKTPKVDGVEIGEVSGNNVYMGINKNDSSDFGASGNHNKAWSQFTDELIQEEVKEPVVDDNGNPVLDDNGEPTYKVVTPAVYKTNPASYHELTCDGEPDWKIVSESQVLVVETTLGNDNWVTTGAVKGFAEAESLVSSAPTKGGLSWKNQGSSNGTTDPRNCRVVSTKAFTAPFDVEVFLASGGSNAASCKLSISKDGNEWTALEPTIYGGPNQRQIKKTRISVEEEGDFFVRLDHTGGSPQLNDITIYNNGELSKDYTGIEDVIANEGAEVISVEYYNINGMRIAEPENGFYIMRATLSNGNTVVTKVVK